jgi:hypothetical protein
MLASRSSASSDVDHGSLRSSKAETRRDSKPSLGLVTSFGGPEAPATTLGLRCYLNIIAVFVAGLKILLALAVAATVGLQRNHVSPTLIDASQKQPETVRQVLDCFDHVMWLCQ